MGFFLQDPEINRLICDIGQLLLTLATFKMHTIKMFDSNTFQVVRVRALLYVREMVSKNKIDNYIQHGLETKIDEYNL